MNDLFIAELPLQPNKEVSMEKFFKTDEEDGAKPKPLETRKVTPNTTHIDQGF